ncbi:MAG TPA: SLC13 family permease [Candidatus Thermoplasmatota archaeon]|nr:SLC13 family permease [Candidatus Thermoplasmatota archaeon]
MATFLLLAAGRLGRLPLPRGRTALAGGLLTALLYRMSWRVVDWDVIALLAALMVLAALAETAGLFAGVRRLLLGRSPPGALALALLLMGLTSALLLNDAAVVVLVPFLLPALRAQGLPLVPSVTLLAVSSNVGSLLTPFGNPQNAAIAAHAHLGVLDFLRVQGPVVLLGAVLLAGMAWLVARHASPAAGALPATQPRGRAIVATGILLFLALAWLAPAQGVGLGVAALVATVPAYLVLRLRIGRDADRAAWEGLDWNVLLLFMGLYALTAGLPHWFPAARLPLSGLSSPWPATTLTAALCNVVGNVPAMLTYIQLDPAWTRLHAPFLVTVSTLGGALFLTGSAAALLAADQARKHGVEVRFWPFLRTASCVIPLLVAGAWWTWGMPP